MSSITVCNRSTATTFRIAHRVAAAALAGPAYLFYDAAIGGNETAVFTLGICLATSDLLTVYAGTPTVSFNAWGVENP